MENPVPRASHPKSRRLLRKSEFEGVRGARKSFRDGVLNIGFRKNGLPVSRLGLSVSIRGIGAVHRNRIKRIVREAFRTMQPPFPAGYDLVVSSMDKERAGQLADVSRSFAACARKISGEGPPC